MANYQKAYAELKPKEGFYSNLATDRGKETFMGISRVYHPHWVGWELVDSYRSAGKLSALKDNLVIESLVAKHYKQYYWYPIQGHNIRIQRIASELFDSAVLMGPGTAVKFIQTVLNKLNRKEKRWPNIKVDGAFGPNTLKVYKKFEKLALADNWRAPLFKRAMLAGLNGLQVERFFDIMDRDEEQEEFALGWLSKRV